jgi:uncharacterized membrane protein (UPF0127 family)
MARSIWRRFLGLMFRRTLPAGSGLVLLPEGQIHMFFMRFALDVVHADRDGVVVRLVEGIKPWRVGPMVRGCKLVVELPVGTIARTGTQVGDTLQLEEVHA